MHNLCIFVRFIDGVKATYYIATIGIPIANADRLYICSLVHDVLSEVSVECRNGTAICSVNGSLKKSVLKARLKKSGAMWLVVCNNNLLVVSLLRYTNQLAGGFNKQVK